MSREILESFEIPDEDREILSEAVIEVPKNLVSLDDLKPEQVANLLFADYLKLYVPLRHTCASLLLNKGKHNGITLKDIQAWLGHSDFSTTANTYSHLDANSKKDSLETLTKVVSL